MLREHASKSTKGRPVANPLWKSEFNGTPMSNPKTENIGFPLLCPTNQLLIRIVEQFLMVIMFIHTSFDYLVLAKKRGHHKENGKVNNIIFSAVADTLAP